MFNKKPNYHLYKFSYIIPALNEEGYIRRCIGSIIAQDLEPHEIIVVDNGSADNTVNIAKKLGAIVVREKKRGIGNARNRGAKRATGNVLCFIDADSLLHRQWAARACFHFDRGSYAVSGLNIFTNKTYWKFLWYNTYTLVAHAMLAFSNFFFGRLHLSAGNLAIKKKVFEKTGGYDNYVGEDYWLSKKFWRLKYQGSFDPFMIVYSSSRGFEKRGMVKTVKYWLVNTVKKVDQSEYSWESEI